MSDSDSVEIPTISKNTDELELKESAEQVLIKTEPTEKHGVGWFLKKYSKKYIPNSELSGTELEAPPKVTGNHDIILRYLRFIPIILGALFIGSFFWDFPNQKLQIFGLELALAGVLRITSVSGLIGYGTNWLAVTMLFQPRAKRPIFGQGLIPAQRERVIFRMAQNVSKELINADIIKERINESGAIRRYQEKTTETVKEILQDEEFKKDLRQILKSHLNKIVESDEIREKAATAISQKVEEYAGSGFKGMALKTYRFFKEDEFKMHIEKAIADLPNSIDHAFSDLDLLLNKIPEKMDKHSDQIEDWATTTIMGMVERIDIYGMIKTNMERFDDTRLETLIKSSSNEQLNYIKYLGGVLGFFGGLIIWQPLWSLLTFGLILLVLVGIDVVLFNSRVARAA